MTILGVDLQARAPNWPAIKAAGYSFGVARCVGENGAIDPDYAVNVKGMAAAGLLPGAYHFIAGGGTVVDHCKRFVDTVGDPKGMLIQLDVERPNYHPIPTIKDVGAWFNEYRKHTDHPVLLYTGGWYWRGVINDPNGAQFTPFLWNSGGWYYRADPPFYRGDDAPEWRASFGGWDHPTLWQYHGTYSLAGVAVDLNAYRNGLNDLRALAGVLPASSTEPPQGGDMSISTGGLTLTSQHQITLPADTPIFEDAMDGSSVLMRVGAAPQTFDYFGASGRFHAIRVDPPARTTVIAYTTSAASVVDKPMFPDPTPYGPAELAAAGTAGQKIGYNQAVSDSATAAAAAIAALKKG